MKDNKIYLDHAAATPVRPEVRKSLESFFDDCFANPSSITESGVQARNSLEQARKTVAEILGAHADEIIFTGSGTESINLAVLGIMRQATSGHIITSAIEHHAVLEPIANLVKHGYQADFVTVKENGIVDIKDILAAVKPETRLISLMLANNEIGTIQPVSELARALRRINKERIQKQQPYIYLHTDACQTPGYLSLNVTKLGVDALSINGAKIGGPKGVGALYLRRGVACEPIIFGGGQEMGMRSGTEAVGNCVALATALSLAQNDLEKESQCITKLRNKLWNSLSKNYADLKLNGDAQIRLPNNLSFVVPGIEAEALVIYADEKGIEIGAGAACSTKTLEPSHVLKAIGRSDLEALSTIRITLGWNTSETDVEIASQKISQVIGWLRTHTLNN